MQAEVDNDRSELVSELHVLFLHVNKQNNDLLLKQYR